MRFEIVRLLRGEKAANSKEKEEEACVEQVNCAALYPLPHTGLSGKIFRFVRENFQICPEKFSDLSGKMFRFVQENFQCLG